MTTPCSAKAYLEQSPVKRIWCWSAKPQTGRKPSAKFRVLRPDVTLMDLQMRGMNGIDAIIEIRK